MIIDRLAGLHEKGWKLRQPFLSKRKAGNYASLNLLYN